MELILVQLESSHQNLYDIYLLLFIIIRIYHYARSSECQINFILPHLQTTFTRRTNGHSLQTFRVVNILSTLPCNKYNAYHYNPCFFPSSSSFWSQCYGSEGFVPLAMKIFNPFSNGVRKSIMYLILSCV